MLRAARLGAFIVAPWAILVVSVFIIAISICSAPINQLKRSSTTWWGWMQEAIQAGGVYSGTVRNMVLPYKPVEKVTVVMDLGQSTHEIIKRDSVASIEIEGLLGNQ